MLQGQFCESEDWAATISGGTIRTMTDELPRIFYEEDESPESRDPTVLHDILKFRRTVESRPALVAVGGARSVGKIFRLSPGETIVGRAVGCGIVLDDEGVSRRHATVRLSTTGEVSIHELQSSNGLVCGGRRVTSHVMQDGERVALGDAALALLHLDDIDETLRQNLLETATEDAETQLLVRRHFRDQVRRELTLATRYQAPISIISLIVDQFRSTVDTAGRTAGAHLVRGIASTIRALIAREDVLFSRYAEDQIMISLPENDSDSAMSAASSLVHIVAATAFKFGDTTLAATVSVGVATAHRTTLSVEELLETAEQNALRAKLAGGNAPFRL